MNVKANLLRFIVPSVDDISWNFVRQVLARNKGLIKVEDPDHIILPPKLDKYELSIRLLTEYGASI